MLSGLEFQKNILGTGTLVCSFKYKIVAALCRDLVIRGEFFQTFAYL